MLVPPAGAASLGFCLLPPPPAPLCAVRGNSPASVQNGAVVVVDTLAECSLARQSPLLEKEDTGAEDDDSDDCGGLLGTAPQVQRRVVVDDGIDSASDCDDDCDNAGGCSSPPPLSPILQPHLPAESHAEAPLQDDSGAILRQTGGWADILLGFQHRVACESPTPAKPKDNPLSGMEEEIISASGSPSSGSQTAAANRPFFVLPGMEAFIVRVPQTFPGLQYRQSKDLSGRLPRYAKDGTVVHGFVEDESAWLKVGSGHFLPMKVGGKCVLEPAPPELAAESCSGYGTSIPSCRHTLGPTQPSSLRDDGGLCTGDAECDDIGAEELVPDEGPRDVPRASYHRMLQPFATAMATSMLSNNGNGTGAGLPPRASSKDVMPIMSSELTAFPLTTICADAHDDAAMDLLLRRVDPFGDPQLEDGAC